MSNHPAWHDQQPQYPPPPPPPQRTRHHSGMDAYQGPSPSASASAQQPPPYNSAPQHTASYPHAHLPPPAARHTPQQQQQQQQHQQQQQQQHPQQPQWASGTSQDFGGPSPANSAPRSNSGYTGFDPSSASNNSPMRQHGGSHSSAYTTHSPYAPPQSHAPDAAMHPQRPSMPSHYDYQNNYPHPHHPQNPQMPTQHHPHPHPHPHPSQQQQQHQQAHWNTGPLPSVLQPQSAPLSSTPSSNRGPSAPPPPPHHAMDRAYPTIKHDDDMDDDDTGNYDDFDPKGKARAAADATQAANKGTSDFVKKLFSMLDDKAYDSVVAWSPSGESFIVKDMNDFTKHVLPRNFRHSNFASFVRQLNKYDFHKVKNPEDGAASVGEHVWEFQHPDFVRGRDDLLENVKRKIPAKKKPAKPGLVDADRDDSPAMPAPVHVDAPQRAESDAELRAQVAHLTAAQDQMQNHILALTKQYQGVIGEMLTFQRNMIQQDQLMQNLIQYLINLDQDRPLDGATAPPSANSFLAHMGANPGFLANPAAASAAPHAVGASAPVGGADAGPSNHAGAAPPLSPKSVASPLDATGSTPEISAQLASLRESNPLAPMMLHPPHLDADPADSSLVNAAASAARNPSLSSFEKAGLRVFTVGTLQPRDSPGDPTPAPPQELAPAGLPNGSAGSSFDVHANGKGKEAADDKKRTPTPGEGQASKHLRVRRSTLVPGWAVPPRVLLVDDDEVCRRLSSKFLQVFGCSIDYAVDGMSAVNKMNLEKYDLVLMDIVMPNLDGMSATSLIRQFDPRTPIISMTSNSGPSELVNYMSSGMTDILPKPFTKEGLLNMLEKHLLHLKAARGTGQEGPKGVSPAPAATPSGTVQTGADDGTLNPLAGMGFTDEEYVAMLQNLIAAGTQDDEAFGMDLKDGKRMAEESGGENKRQRFVDS